MISVHIITGFLGVGKTTLVKQLLSQKPEEESWAVIVNEFGELGVDALMLESPSITIKQVPGGCACCAANLPFQMSLNQLLKSKKLDRILIEPSGLGHGDMLAQLLDEDQYKEWLTLDGVITLIDPLQFKQDKYRNHDIYIRQLQVADAIVISKADLASKEDIDQVQNWAHSSKRPALISEHGYLPLSWLEGIQHKPSMMLFRPVSKGDNGYFTQGVQFSSTIIFDHEPTIKFFKETSWSRTKGIIQTNQGWFQINFADDVFDVTPTTPKEWSIIEIIHDRVLPESLENELISLYKEKQNGT